MSYNIEELKDMPIMVDKLTLLLYSKKLMRRYNDPYYERIGIKKSELTKNTREFINQKWYVEGIGNKMKDCYRDIENVIKSGKPRFQFKSEFWKNCYANTVQFQGYDNFMVRIYTNPTLIQKEVYNRRGLLNNDINEDYKTHSDNFLYPQLLNNGFDNKKIEEENKLFFPNNDVIGKYVTSEILKLQEMATERAFLSELGMIDDIIACEDDPEQKKKLDSMMKGGLYRSASCSNCEVNRDILLPDDNSKGVLNELVRFILSSRGRQYLSSKKIVKGDLSFNLEYNSDVIYLNLPKGYGVYKIYSKTNYTIRCEIILGKKDFLKNFGSCKLTYVKGGYENVFYNDVIIPALNLIDVKAIISDNIKVLEPSIKLLIDKVSKDIVDKRFWKKVYSNSVFQKKEIPKEYLHMFECFWKYDRNIGRSNRLYRLKDKYLKEFGIEKEYDNYE